jgi:hypothetical protein
MSNALSFRVFNERWLTEFSKHATAHKSGERIHDHWQGSLACAELRTKGLLAYLIFDSQPSDDPVWPVHQYIFREVETYGRLTSKVVNHNHDFKEAIDFLRSAERRFSKEKQQLRELPRLKGAFEEMVKFLAAKRAAIQKAQEAYWKEVACWPTEGGYGGDSSIGRSRGRVG